MTNQQHPITPPPELIEQWMQVHTTKYDLARQAAQWGADQELEACCEWIPKATPWDAEQLRAARRPKPPSLKEQALAALERYEAEDWCEEMTFDSSVIRRALEQLDD
jgi:hypothetical protein